MPRIHGVKMACEPCIRGHRATTCNHANERVMIPVRKPGRPLSTCPHRASERRTCGCHGITVAFPRRQKCACVGSASGAKGGEVDSSRTAPSVPYRVAASPSPSVSSNRSYRSSVSTKGPPSTSGGSATAEMINNFAMMTPPTISSSLARDNQPTFQQLLYQQNPPGGGLGRSNQGSAQSFDFLDDYDLTHAPLQPNTPEHVDRDGRRTSISTAQDTTVSSAGSPVSTMSSYTADSQSSFASYAGADALTQYGFGEAAPRVLHGTRGTRGQSSQYYQTSLLAEEPAANEPLCSNCLSQVQPSQPTTPMPPPPPPLAMHLINPTQLRIGPGGALYVVLPQGLPPAEQNAAAIPTSTSLAIPPALSGSSRGSPLAAAHNCSCGPTCQCIGCLSHPFNNATQEYVQSAFQHGFERDGDPPPTLGLDMDVADTVSSAAEREASLPPNDFILIDYQLGGGQCEGDTGHCPCGDECQCIGCTIHSGNTTIAFGGVS